MLVVTLVATLAAGLQWRQWRAYNLEAAARAQSQASWVLVGALDWSRLILREDVRASQNAPVDHLAEPWALPLKEAKLSSFLSADSLALETQEEAYLSGQITDAQAKLNLSNLVEGGKLIDSELAKFARLYSTLKLPPEELAAWSQEWLRSLQSESGPLQPKTIQNLDWVGLSANSAKTLDPYITLLPNKTPVNLNTASAIVIHAALGGIDITQAERWVIERLQTPLRVQTEAADKLGLPSNSIKASDADVTSHFFEVSGRLRLGDWVIEEKSLVQRIGQDVKTIWRSRQQ